MFASRGGFTLVELLVAITILLVISALTFTMVNVTLDKDRIRSGSREVQAFLEGARNQAIYAKEPRGVRFLLNPNDPSTCNSMLFIGPPSRFSGTVGVQNMITTFDAVPGDWTANLAPRGLLVDGARIRIPRTTGEWYTISDAGGGIWTLTKPYEGLNNPTETYELELAPAVLPNQEPRLLPEGIVIDLDNSLLPPSWVTAPGPPPTYSTQMDLLFSPRGTVTGAVGGSGRIHFLLSDTDDTNLDMTNTADPNPRQRLYPAWVSGNAYNVGDWVVPVAEEFRAYRCLTAGNAGATVPFGEPGEIVSDDVLDWQCFAKNQNKVVSLVTQTGSVASFAADVNVRAPAIIADPFYYAETGEVAR